MLPVFRSKLSAASFCGLLAGLLALPVVTKWVGHVPREQMYASITDEAGPEGIMVREIYHDPSDCDVLLLGSSLVRHGVDRSIMEQTLSAHLGRPAHVVYLALNWQGMDLQYFLLRDYLSSHKVKLIVWNLPVPGSRSIVPHMEAFRFIRYGEYSDALEGLPTRYRWTLYGDMVLGAPRELLAHVRPNLLSAREMTQTINPTNEGYYGAPFVAEPTEIAQPASLDESYENPPYAKLRVTGKPLNAYELHFARKIVELAREHGARLVFLHIPIDSEVQDQTLPERGDWAKLLGVDAPMIGLTGATTFQGVPAAEVNNYFLDQHLNANGDQVFTKYLMPALVKAYDSQDGR